MGVSTQMPFGFSFIPEQISGIEDENELKAVVFDLLGGHAEAVGYFTVN
jgi:hypothetical protein